MILRCVAACLFLAEDFRPTKSQNQNQTIAENGGSSTSEASMEKVLETLITKLQAHHEEVMKSEVNYKALESPIQGPDRSRLTNFVEINHCSMLIKLFRAVLDAQKSGNGDVDANPNEYLQGLPYVSGHYNFSHIKLYLVL